MPTRLFWNDYRKRAENVSMKVVETHVQISSTLNNNKKKKT